MEAIQQEAMELAGDVGSDVENIRNALSEVDNPETQALSRKCMRD